MKHSLLIIACIATLIMFSGCSHTSATNNASSGKGNLEFPNTGHAPTAADMQQIQKNQAAHKGDGK